MEQAAPELRRTLGQVALTVYAVGDILGAGIYALVGRVVALAGSAAWVSFALAAGVAVFTGLSYAELGSRFPFAAGAAAYSRRAFGSPLLSFVVGAFVMASGLSSAATVSRAFVGYLSTFVTAPPVATSMLLLALMSVLSYRGLDESSKVNFVLTFVEFSGLVLVMVVGYWYAASGGSVELAARVAPRLDGGVLAGATIAFFAFIGFEDTANVAEEVQQPERALPRAILVAISLAFVLYVLVTVAGLLTVPQARLAASDAPLLEVLRVAGIQLPGGAFSIIALFSICNTGLLNLIMASRLAYGMAREGLLPAALGRVHPVRRTPWVAVLAAFGLAAALAVSGTVTVLAQTTGLLLLAVFAVLHVALLLVKQREPQPGPGRFTTPRWTPVAGLVASLGLLSRYPAQAYARGAVVLALALVLYLLLARRARGARA